MELLIAFLERVGNVFVAGLKRSGEMLLELLEVTLKGARSGLRGFEPL